jgi:hypothetical protein
MVDLILQFLWLVLSQFTLIVVMVAISSIIFMLVKYLAIGKRTIGSTNKLNGN